MLSLVEVESSCLSLQIGMKVDPKAVIEVTWKNLHFFWVIQASRIGDPGGGLKRLKAKQEESCHSPEQNMVNWYKMLFSPDFQP